MPKIRLKGFKKYTAAGLKYILDSYIIYSGIFFIDVLYVVYTLKIKPIVMGIGAVTISGGIALSQMTEGE